MKCKWNYDCLNCGAPDCIATDLEIVSHDTARRTGVPAEERLRRRREYYAEHRDEIRASQKRYYEEHKEEALARKKQYYEAHREEILAYQKRYCEAHREERTAQMRAYRQRKKEAAIEV